MGFTDKAEKLNGRVAMVFIMVMFGTYFATGQIIPGIW